ncbi:MAG: hypothetical protein GX916_06505 [Clostridiales bacterium]|jgi:lysophospholipase L1-like esterase|nr:hypothetical protein [Clostridiales bacterium]
MHLWTQRLNKRPKSTQVSRLLFGLTALITALTLTVGALGEYTFPPASQVDYPNYPAPFVPILEEAVPVTYFHDAILVGDSLAEGFRLSGALKDLKVLSKIGQSAAGILNNRGYKLDGKSVDLVTYLHSINPGKIYLWVGSNGIDKYKVSHVIKSYEGMIDLLVTEFPDTLIYCMSVAPVIESRVRKKLPSFTNNKVRKFNQEIVRVAGERNCYYLPVYDVLEDGKGGLSRDSAAGDGIHLKKEGYDLVANYLLHHALPWEGGD